MEKTRGFWDSRMAFVMAAVGSAVGLGNIWRFPYVCYKNGGGAFLIPYLIALFTAGVPLLILEFGLGHRAQLAAPAAFAKIRKQYEWIGWVSVIVGLIVMTYYGVVMGWCFNFLYHSFTLGWGQDTNAFFFKNVLQLSGGIGEIGPPVWHIVLGLFLCWLFVFLCIYKGVKSVGKVVMYTVPLPVIILILFVVRGVTLPGAAEGLQYFLTPDFNVLKDPAVWLAAYGQVFFSLSIGFGVMIAYASYLPEDSDITNNAFITSFADAGISFLAGLAVFSTLGFLAVQQGQPVESVVASGPGLAFVTYPTIINNLPLAPQVFGVLFFILLLTLGIDSAFSLVEAGVAGIIDKWKFPRVAVNAGVSFIAFLIGVVYATKGGLYWLDIVDHYLTSFGLTMIGLLECIIIGYVLGARKVREHVNKTSEIKIGYWWDVCIMYITPGVLVFMFMRSAYLALNSAYEGYPAWAQFAGGWGLILLLTGFGVLLAKDMRWIARALTAGALIAVFAGMTYWIGTGVKINLPPNAVAMLILASTVLFGGLAWCLSIAASSGNKTKKDINK